MCLQHRMEFGEFQKVLHYQKQVNSVLAFQVYMHRTEYTQFPYS